MNRNLFRRLSWSLPALVIGGFAALPAVAQTSASLHGFTPFTENDGSNPNGGMVLAGSVLYGTTGNGGSNFTGTIFRVNTDGTGYTNLYTFSATVYQVITNTEGGGGIGIGGGGGREGGSPTNTDGTRPNGGLVLSGNTLYGTAQSGGFGGYGAIFAIHTDGSGFTNLHSFSTATTFPTNSDGLNPNAGLVLSGNTLFGTTRQGGSLGWGTVFRINTDGSGLTELKAFAGLAMDPVSYIYGNDDGAEPQTHLVLADGTLYGTTSQGGNLGGGTLFSLSTNGTGFASLHAFSTYVDGGIPNALTIAGTALYGTASQGGANIGGTVFSINTNGTGFALLHSFAYDADGYNPTADVIIASNLIYGAAGSDGNNYAGTIFKMSLDGSNFGTLYTFSAPNLNTNVEGTGPNGFLLAGSVIYGTAAYGGATGNGAVFSLNLAVVAAPALNITSQGTSAILTWSTTAADYTLQSTPNLAPPVVWGTVTPAPVIVNGLETVTNPVAGNLMFYRLIK